MARKKKKRGHAKKRKATKKRHTKRRHGAKRRYIGSALHKYNLARKRGKHKRHGKRKKSHGRKKNHGRKHHGSSPRSNKGHEVMQRLINRGRTPHQAARVAARIERMRAGKARRYFEKEAVKAKSAESLSNLFANIGAAGHLASIGKS